MPKVCPRCSGPMEAKADRYGSYLRCMLCGHYIDLLQPPPETLFELMKPELPRSRHDYFRKAP